MRLFDRRWSLTVATIRTTGLDIRFRIDKSLKRSPNTAEFSVVNLSADHRHQLAQLDSVPVLLEAGYGDHVGRIFLGDLRDVTSERDGADWITTISGDDGGDAIRTARVNRSHGPGATLSSVLEGAAEALGVGIGNAVTALANRDLEGAGRVFVEGVVLSGPAADELDGLVRSAGYEWSIQNGALQVLPLGGALERPAYHLTPETGLLGSPTVTRAKRGAKATLRCRTLLLPALAPGQRVVVDSDSVHGTFRVDKMSITGDSAGEEWGSEIEGSVPE